MKDCKPRKTPFRFGVKLEEASSNPLVNNTLYRQLIGCFIYLTHTRIEIYYAVSVASRQMDQPHEIHWKAAKIILNFVQGTRTHGIFYATKSDLELVGFTDSEWEGDNTDRKYTLGFVFILIYGPIIFSSKNKSTISLSSIEEMYRGDMNATTQCLWLQGILGEFWIKFDTSIVIYGDNQIII